MMYKRKIEHERGYAVEPVVVPETFEPAAWLAEQASAHGLDFLLAYADDGVIWGRFDDTLHLSGSAFPAVSPPLRKISLQQARLFGSEAELLLWKDGGGAWCARLLRDAVAAEDETACTFDEDQWQWGDRFQAPKSLAGGNPQAGFTLVNEGAEGRYHAVPLQDIESYFDDETVRDNRWRPLRLRVRHYLEADEDGVLFVAQSRLVKVFAEARKEEQSDD